MMDKSEIYLDHNATTPVDSRVLEAMLPYFSDKFGNAASRTHSFGWIADEAVKNARQQVAKLINCLPQEIIFTSGATEAINLALKGAFEIYGHKKNHIVTVATEHKAVLDTCKALEKRGAEVDYLPVKKDGLVDLDALEQHIKENTLIVCVMLANNETGVIQAVKEIAALAHTKGAFFMCDGTQAVGKIPVDVQLEGIDLLCLSAHKFYGPKGVGALYVRRKDPRVTLQAQIDGGGHERGLRSGTLNVPGIVGLGVACELAGKEMMNRIPQLAHLRSMLEDRLLQLDGVFVNGNQSKRLSHVSNLSFDGIQADRLITKLRGIAVATGSACTSASMEPSHVLKAMYQPVGAQCIAPLLAGSIRFSLGKDNTREEIEFVTEKLIELIQEMRI